MLRLLIVFFFFLAVPLCAQSRIDSLRLPDSSRVFLAAPLDVTADNIPFLPAPDGLHARSAELLRERGAVVLSQALARVSPSLQLRRYSSLGGVSFASFRGLPPEYTSVFRDGLRLYNEQNSLIDMGRIGLLGTESIEILPADKAILLAGDAGGAVINLRSGNPGDSLRIYANTSTESADDISSLLTKEFAGSITGPAGPLLFSAFGQYSDSRGDFPFFQPTSGGVVRRENNRAKFVSCGGGLTYSRTSGSKVGLTVIYSRADRGAPGAATTPGRGASSLVGRQQDEEILVAVPSRQVWENFSLLSSVGYQTALELYDDQTYRIHDTYKSAAANASTLGRYRWSVQQETAMSLALETSNLRSNELRYSAADTAARRSRGSFVLSHKYSPSDNLSVVFGARAELISDLPAEVLPQFAATWQGAAALTASFSKLYHAPTLNELYWKTLGDRSLRSEHGEIYSLTAALPEVSTEALSISSQLTLFQHDIRGQIVWLPAANGLTQPQNIARVLSRGLEASMSASYRIAETLMAKMRGGVTVLSSKNHAPASKFFGKAIPYSSPLQVLVSLSLSDRELGSAGLSLQYSGSRFTDFANSIAGRLPDYLQIDVRLAASVIFVGLIAVTPSIFVNNLFNVQHEEVRNYPLPGRTIRFSITTEL